MSPQQLREKCEAAIADKRTGGKVQLLVKGSFTRSGRKRLLGKIGPWGTCIADMDEDSVLAVFDAAEVLKFVNEQFPPIVAIGNEELQNAKWVEKGDEIECKHCGGRHRLETGQKVLEDGTREESDDLLYYKCGDNTYLAALKNRLIGFPR